jgi:putative flippase GtrA
MRPAEQGPPNHRASIVWFLGIGGLAGLVHYVVALALHGLAQATPGVANVAGFLSAFPVSYYGHRTLSFAATAVPHRHAMPRLFIVSALSFLINQALLLSLLALTPLPLWSALAIVLVVVSLITYALSRAWVFARSKR